MGVSVRGTVHPYLRHPCPKCGYATRFKQWLIGCRCGPAFTRALNPSAAATVCTAVPTADPAVATSPARRPPAMPCAIMNIIPGPGTAFEDDAGQGEPKNDVCLHTINAITDLNFFSAMTAGDTESPKYVFRQCPARSTIAAGRLRQRPRR